MLAIIEKLLQEKNVFHHSNEGITVCVVNDNPIGLVTSLLYAVVDVKTVLYLSGGRTPRELYQTLASEEQLVAGAVGQVDERYGEPYHPNSNQKMIRETGLLRYFEMRDIPFYPMLDPSSLRGVENDEAISSRDRHALPLSGIARDDILRQATAQRYDEKVRSLHATFQKSVAILGIGSDGHTAGLPVLNSHLRQGFGGQANLKSQISKIYNGYDLVTEYDDTSGKYGERVTMTFLGLSMMDLLIVLVFGDDKKQALEHMFNSGSEAEIPARFYKRPEIAKKMILITDQLF